MTPSTILEVVICTVKDDPAAEAARTAAMQAVRRYPGFISWQALTALDLPGTIADIVEWQTHQAAMAAAEKVRTDPAFAPYMQQIASVSVVGHFETTKAI
ncbi:hypothetical protein HHL25_01795 [Rhizobium sp. S-51]|uniref:ABM domain-containing protein n=1 Tax=Rhizobium terricola TaxID=2728849 RepID=A0A7Y0ASS9_9HYPH|nr:hypothetical protein [Rhizobium terricola]NML72849.1 hypothetical protein [Rhizobium terricola]